jgi:hypothetical protein
MKILNQIINRTRLAVSVGPALFLLLSYCTCFPAAAAMGAEGWRVIAEDPRFPTDDVIVAFCSVIDPQYELPADPAKSDCTPAIQRALDDARPLPS